MRIVILLSLLMGSLCAEGIFSISTVRDSKMQELSALVIKEAYSKIGIDLQILYLPSENSLQVANAGLVEGEISRTRKLDAKYGNLLRVPVEINHISGVAFARNPNIKVVDFWSLSPYRIAIVKGCRFSAKGTRGLRVRTYENETKAFKALKRKKVDIVILPLVDGLQTLKEQKIRGVYVLENSLAHIPLYHYIHKQNSHLGVQLTKVLRKMKKSGRIKEIRQTYLAELRP